MPDCDAFLAGIERVGHQPFIQIGFESGNETTFLVCVTQQHLAPFVSELQSTIVNTPSRFLAGVCSSLSGEHYDAGEQFFRWCVEGDRDVDIDVLGFDGVEHPFSFRLDFPAVVVRETSRVSGSNRGADARAAALDLMLQRYHWASGNDSSRWSLIEGIALGLCRYHGSVGSYAAAWDCIDIALGYAPKSIHLRAAQRALDLKFDGKDVPSRLEKFIGEDSGALLGRICSEPFRRFDISPSGEVLVCCGHWLPTPIGNVMRDEVDDVLNSPSAQKIRASILDGSYRYCNHLECSALIQGYLPKKEEVTDPVVRRAIDDGDLKVDKVEQMLFAFDQSCNLSCPSCRIDRIIERPDVRDVKTNIVASKLMPLLKGMRFLDINPAGEVFSSKPSRRILELVSRETCPDLDIDIISNGTLFTEKEWANLPNLKDMVRSVRVSTDGATKATFEKLRRLAVWETFIRNVTFLGALRERGEIRQLKMSFTYQLDNFREMREFVNFAKGFSSDYVIFERLQNLGAYTWEEFHRKAVHLSDHPLHQEFLDVIKDPIFAQHAVWHDFEWEGAAALSEEEAAERWTRANPATAASLSQFINA